MCIKLDEKEVFNYIANFFAGLVASLAVVFGLGQQNQLTSNILWFFIAIIVLFFVGLMCLNFAKIFKPENKKR